MDILRKAIGSRGRKRPYCAAIVVAAGAALRMNGIDKMLADLCGKTVLLRTIQALNDSPYIDEIVVVTREDLLLSVNELCQSGYLDKVCAVTLGGDTRRDSVMAGLACVSDRTALVAVQDGARPLVTQEIIEQAVKKAAETGAAAPAVPVKDTIKVSHKCVIEETPDRGTLFAVQTPQVFDADLLRGALFKAQTENAIVTDDCSAVERIGMKVHLTEGSEENIKITTPLDLAFAELILKKRNGQM